VDQFRRVGGELVPHRRPTGRRLLLPAEAELCNAIGLSADEYWYFLELTEAYNGERAKEYELVPDVVNDAGLTVAIISLVIGVASTAVSFLLAPKPRAPQARQREAAAPNLRTGDQAGTRRFAPLTGFDSVQELANIGQIIPLIFTRKGVRVAGQLLWSQMLSLGTGQQLRAIVMFGNGIEQAPDFEGFAIGDTLLENYTRAKIALYFRTDGGRFVETGDRYPEGTAEILDTTDAFSVFWDRTQAYEPYFSGTRTPSTQTQFGAYAPMPNGNAFKVNYELVLKPDNVDGQIKNDIDVKRNKLSTRFPCRAAVISISSTGAVYRIASGEEIADGFSPWGLEDVNSSVEAIRINADEACAVGDLYLIGERFAVGQSLNTTRAWDTSVEKDFTLSWSDETPYTGFVETRSVLDRVLPYENAIIQRAAVAVVSNNRSCDVTEIGIRSVVWKQINGFPNINSRPSSDVLISYEQKNGSIALGSINKYIKRLSFFRLFVRPLGQDADWTDISYGTLFCVSGQTPQPQYNYIRISQIRGQYEFKLAPVPGTVAHRFFTDRDVWLLRPGSRFSYSTDNFTIVFSGTPFRLTVAEQCNREWIFGTPPDDFTGAVVGVDRYTNGIGVPLKKDWVLVSTRLNADNNVKNQWPAGATNTLASTVYFRWDGNIVGTQPYDNNTGNVAPLNVTGDVQYRPTNPTVETITVQNARGGSQYISYEASISRYEWQAVDTSITNQVVNASGGSGSGLQFRVRQYNNGAIDWSIESQGTGYRSGDSVLIPVANQTVILRTDEREVLTENQNPFDAITDFPLYDAERSSHMDGPEHEVVYVNEQLAQSASQYDNLAIAGLRINSSKEWSNFSSLSAFIKLGTRVNRLLTPSFSATNLLPEIAYALLTDTTIGAGASIGTQQVDKDRMTLAAQFCQANNFTWDGVISDRINLREWIYEQAGYCLLDFTILGGRFSLVPSVPYNTNYVINPEGKPAVKALFTDGNIRNMKVTWLSPEERRLFKATCLWRQDKDNGFPETKVVSVRLADFEGGSEGDPEETFDMSGWCTTQEHPLTFARYALKLRQLVDHSVTFETTPQAAMNLAPGEYFRLVSEVTHTSRFNNGSISEDGIIQSQDLLDGSYSILYWVPGTTEVQSGTLTATNGRTTQTVLFGTVFALNNTTTVNRLYKVETLSYGEDGLVDVAASYAPLTDRGTLAVLDWGDDEMFVIETY